MSSAQEILMAAAGATPTVAATYIEDVFSTYLYTGNGGTQTVTTGLDLSTNGGLVWIKNRTNALTGHAWTDTARGAGTGTTNTATNIIASNSSNGTGGGLPASGNDYLSAFTTTGFTVISSNGANNATRITNRSSDNYVAWSFEKQAKFFDIVTYTGTGVARNINHNLGSVPGCIIIKRLDSSFNWQVYHRSLGNTTYIQLNLTNASVVDSTRWNNTTPTSTVFTVGTNTTVNANGGTYVAYLFAHDAGGFGASGSDNVISCGSYTGNGTTSNTITLGYEPQWVLIKRSSVANDEWMLFDTMRGMPVGGLDAFLQADTTGAENSGSQFIAPTATGFQLEAIDARVNANGSTYIYIAIRRGPMRTPTSGTSVYNAIARAGTGATATVTGVGFTPDLVAVKSTSATYGNRWTDRLRGAGWALVTDTADAQLDNTTIGVTGLDVMNGAGYGAGNPYNNTPETYINWFFRRAPGFFDEVCYTGTGANRTLNHNLGVAPELMIVKGRSGATAWQVYSSALANTEYLVLNTTAAKATGATRWNSTTPTSTVFSLGTATEVNTSAATYVAYLFATVSGVSKVGSYTGTGALQTVNCGFTSGARFVLIKRTDSTGDWYVYDSARGITSGSDPYLLLNSTAAEVTGTNYVDTDTTGFKVTAAAPAGLNANGGTYIFLAIA